MRQVIRWVGFALLVVSNTWLLSGCIPAAIAVGVAAGAGGKAIADDNRTAQTIQQDQDARGYAQHWLNTDPVLKGQSHISVSVINHMALLVGQARTPEVKARAYEIVSRVKNIHRIYNEITIAEPISTSQRMRDSWLTTKVKSALVATSSLKSNDIKVVTEDGIVYLMGLVTPNQADLAVDSARHVEGVRKVMKVFEYLK